ncbi:MAG TPA: phosphoribosyltransferase family protein [Acidimicrobiales bacterium]|nr:phosphoribosyltransferase family protein [Acidimicrobiales bacterium]
MVLGTLLPVRCPGCGATGEAPCPPCASRLRAAPPGPVPEGLDACWSLVAYEGVGRTLVTGLKYRRDRAAVAWLADRMAALGPGRPATGPPTGAPTGAAAGVPIVTWAPTTGARRRQRGFDQAELLARAVARRWGAPCRPLLARRAGPPQTGRSLADRRDGPILLARAGSRAAAGRVIVVVDDVLTTGSTLRAAARALQVVGPASVVGLTAARTPRHPAAPPCVLPRPPKVEQFAQVPRVIGR